MTIRNSGSESDNRKWYKRAIPNTEKGGIREKVVEDQDTISGGEAELERET